MPTRTVTTQEAEHEMHKLLTWVSHGDEVFITENDQPLAKIVPIKKNEKKRMFGKFAGKISISDDIDASLPADFWLGGKVK